MRLQRESQLELSPGVRGVSLVQVQPQRSPVQARAQVRVRHGLPLVRVRHVPSQVRYAPLLVQPGQPQVRDQNAQSLARGWRVTPQVQHLRLVLQPLMCDQPVPKPPLQAPQPQPPPVPRATNLRVRDAPLAVREPPARLQHRPPSLFQLGRWHRQQSRYGLARGLIASPTRMAGSREDQELARIRR